MLKCNKAKTLLGVKACTSSLLAFALEPTTFNREPLAPWAFSRLMTSEKSVRLKFAVVAVEIRLK